MPEQPIPANLWRRLMHVIHRGYTGQFFFEIKQGVIHEGGFKETWQAEEEQKASEPTLKQS